MANLAHNHLWLLGTPDQLARWSTAGPWAALSNDMVWGQDLHGLFHPKHGYPVGVVITFTTHRNPVSVYDPERRAGIGRDVDQFLAYADEGWLDAGHEWRLRADGRRPDDSGCPRTPAFESRHSWGDSPDPTCPSPSGWVTKQASVWQTVALERMRQVPLPIGNTSLPLVLRRALWRDDGPAVTELLEQPSIRPSPTDAEAWWFGVQEAARIQAWRIPGMTSETFGARASGEAGQALRAWLLAMPETLRDVNRASQMLNGLSVDPGVRTALSVWVPADRVWDLTGLNLSSFSPEPDPGTDSAMLRLWNATSPSQQAVVTQRWLGHLTFLARQEGDGLGRQEPRLLDLLDALVAQRGLESPLLRSEGLLTLVDQGWPRLATWAETQHLRSVMPASAEAPAPRVRL